MSLKGLLLPNIDYFKVEASKIDKILDVLGITKVWRRNFYFSKAANTRANRYLRRVWAKLDQYAKEKRNQSFDNLGKIFLKRSSVLRTLLLHRVEKNWFEILSLKQLERAIWNMNKLIAKDSRNFKFVRVEIPKADGSKRPLSVPPLEWRMIANYYSILLKIWVSRNARVFNKVQYGIMEGKGPQALWKEILDRIEESRYIYEFDLVAFFDTVQWDAIEYELKNLNVPKNLRNWCMDSIRKASILHPEERLSELEQLMNTYVKKLGETDSRTSKVANWAGSQSFRIHLDKYLDWCGSVMTGESDWVKSLKWAITTRSKKLEIFELLGQTPLTMGVPQGFGLSPLLATLSLNSVYRNWSDSLLMYLDDGLIMSEDEPDLMGFRFNTQGQGVLLNSNKSGWIRYDGKWLKPLKFLGIEYDPWKDTLKGNTRNGSTVETLRLDFLGKYEIFEQGDYKNSWLKSIKDLANHSKLVATNLWGYNFALMYGSPKVQPERHRVIPRGRTLKEALSYDRDKKGLSSIYTSSLINVMDKVKYSLKKEVIIPILTLRKSLK